MRRKLKFGRTAGLVTGERHLSEAAIKELVLAEAKNIGVRVVYDVDRHVVAGEGVVDDFPSGKSSKKQKFPLFVGTADLAVSQAKDANVTAFGFTKGLVAAWHEVHHCEQTVAQQVQYDETTVEWSLSHLGTRKNPRFYLEEYPRNKREMHVELNALQCVRPYLDDLFCEDEAEELLLEYVAWRTLPENVPDGPDDHETKVVYPNYFISPADTDDGYCHDPTAEAGGLRE